MAHVLAPERVADPLPLHVLIPGLPPTVNLAYLYAGAGGKRRTPAAVAWAAGAGLIIRAAAAQAGGTWPRQRGLALIVGFQDPRYLKWDCDNRLKLLIDTVMRALDLDDRYITLLEVYKERAALCQTTVTLRLLDEDVAEQGGPV